MSRTGLISEALWVTSVFIEIKRDTLSEDQPIPHNNPHLIILLTLKICYTVSSKSHQLRQSYPVQSAPIAICSYQRNRSTLELGLVLRLVIDASL